MKTINFSDYSNVIRPPIKISPNGRKRQKKTKKKNINLSTFPNDFSFVESSNNCSFCCSFDCYFCARLDGFLLNSSNVARGNLSQTYLVEIFIVVSVNEQSYITIFSLEQRSILVKQYDSLSWTLQVGNIYGYHK